jgi:hypothetical protein
VSSRRLAGSRLGRLGRHLVSFRRFINAFAGTAFANSPSIGIWANSPSIGISGPGPERSGVILNSLRIIPDQFNLVTLKKIRGSKSKCTIEQELDRSKNQQLKDVFEKSEERPTRLRSSWKWAHRSNLTASRTGGGPEQRFTRTSETAAAGLQDNDNRRNRCHRLYNQ